MGRILSGMRPTGRMHLGNYAGPFVNWLALQTEYECLFMVADWHMLTTQYDRTDELQQNLTDMVTDWLAAGLDPDKASIFVQSQVPEHAELHLLLSMLAPLSWCTRNPSLKEMVRSGDQKASLNYGLVGYPVLQAADILVYRADLVPVGEDQLPHLEMTRELCRRFNALYGEVFPEPQGKLSPHARLPGIDGKRMSKSAGNHISMSDSPDEVNQKIKRMITDPQKVRRGDPGRPEVCSVHDLRGAFNLAKDNVESECLSGALGCVACKQDVAAQLNSFLDPIRQRRLQIESKRGYVAEVLSAGRENASALARDTMEQVRTNMNLNYEL